MKRKPRIVFIIGSMREGGAEGQLVHLAAALRRRGWQVGVMLLHHEGVRIADLEAADVRVFDVNLPRFRPRWSPLPWLRLIPTWWRSRAFLTSFRPDIVHAWLFWGHVWGALLLGLSRVPFVTSRRNTWSDKKRSRAMHTIETCIDARADAIVANSAAGTATVGRAREKVTTIRNGVDIEAIDATPAAYLRAEFPALANCRRIAVYTANILPHKNHESLLRAWKRIDDLRPATGLVCIGRDGGSMGELRGLAGSLGMPHVVFAGARRDVPALVKGADFAIHASLDEGLSNAIIEYMACGLATVVTDVGGNREIVRDRETGFLAASVDSPVFRERVLDLIDDPEYARALGAAGRRAILETLSVEKMAARHVQLYGRVIRRKRRKAAVASSHQTHHPRSD